MPYGGPTYTVSNPPTPDPTTHSWEQIGAQTGLAAPVAVNDQLLRALLAQQGGLSGQFADQAQQAYSQMGTQGQLALQRLRNQAEGRDSFSAEQLRQGLQQQLAQQRALAASASPRNSALAAMTAGQQAGRLGAALGGQQAMAGIQERQAANAQYAQLLASLRGQEMQSALQARQTAQGAYGQGMPSTPPKTWEEKYLPALAQGAAAIAMFAKKQPTDRVESGGPITSPRQVG